MIGVSVLASGSSGNSFFYEADDNAFLIDCGVSCKQIELRLNQIGKDPNKIKAMFITHEHIDHIRGCNVFARKYNTPIYITEKTYKNSYFYFLNSKINFIQPDKKFKIGKIKIDPFSKFHDSIDPISYKLTYKNKKVLFLTDVGKPCKNVIKRIKKANIICLESNHDLEMLENGPYPKFLKQRIKSENGHLSNYDAALLVLEHASNRLKHIFLSHLSENNNTPELALATVKTIINERQDLQHLNYHLTYRDKPTEIIKI